MKMVILFCIVLVTLLFSCSPNTCSDRLGFEIDNHLFDKIKVNGYTYCELVNRSLDKDKQAIIDLSKVSVGDGASYQHGAVLIEVIDLIGEIEYLKIVQSLTTDEKKRIYNSFLPAGIEYTPNKKYSNVSTAVAFPKMDKLLKYSK